MLCLICGRLCVTSYRAPSSVILVLLRSTMQWFFYIMKSLQMECECYNRNGFVLSKMNYNIDSGGVVMHSLISPVVCHSGSGDERGQMSHLRLNFDFQRGLFSGCHSLRVRGALKQSC